MCVWPHLVGDSPLTCNLPVLAPPSPGCPSMHRCSGALLLADGSLYAVGGYDSSSHLATVEKYEPQVRGVPYRKPLSPDHHLPATVAISPDCCPVLTAGPQPLFPGC